jgi:hypothetical protein
MPQPAQRVEATEADMRNWLLQSDSVAIAILFACCLHVYQRVASNRWKRRCGAFGSPMISSPGYRLLFLLVLIGLLLIAVLPEAAMVLPVVDAVGLDIVTIFAALELRHYLASVARSTGIPTDPVVYLRVGARLMGHDSEVLRTNPILLLYACVWPLVRLRPWLR